MAHIINQQTIISAADDGAYKDIDIFRYRGDNTEILPCIKVRKRMFRSD